MMKDSFLARCHPHVLGEDGHVDLGQCEALQSDMEELRELGVILTLVGSYAVGAYRYTNLGDALVQAKKHRNAS